MRGVSLLTVMYTFNPLSRVYIFVSIGSPATVSYLYCEQPASRAIAAAAKISKRFMIMGD